MITMKAHIVLHQFALCQWLHDLPRLSQIVRILNDPGIKSKYKPPGAYFLKGLLIIGGIFTFQIQGGFYTEEFIHGGAYFRNFTV